MITFDSLTLNAFIIENLNFLLGGRINKIQQPTRRELILSIRNQGETKSFYINIDPKFYHLCFTSIENIKKKQVKIPDKPPVFCMLLRKYIQNTRISKVVQPENERILELYFETYNELKDKIYLCLAIELMGKYSNIILYNCDTNIIIGCAHNVGSEKSSIREVYGTIPYIYPPKQNNDIFLYKRYDFLLKIKNCGLKDIYSGINVNNMIDNYFSDLIYRNKFYSLKSEYTKNIQKKLKKIESSLSEMELTISKQDDLEKYRLYGDLIMGNLYNLKDFSPEINVYDYENDKQISIKLDKTKTLKENANKFYKKYNNAKISKQKLSKLSEKYLIYKNYYENLLYSVKISKNIEDLEELQDEIIENEKTEKKSAKSEPQKIEIENGNIYIGKNNKQNDYIVSKLGKDEDFWFHTKDCPGAHVLLKTQNVTDELILKCAKLAKEYSSASQSPKAGIIYTKIKNIKKPPKAPLGYVTYKNEKEIIVE